MKVLIAGWAGSGKSALAIALQACKLPALDTDNVMGLCSWRDKQTNESVEVDYGKAIDFQRLGWDWDATVLQKTLADYTDLFLCGNATNIWDYINLFDVFFVLNLDETTQRQRLLERTNSVYGKEPSVLSYTLAAQKRFVTLALKAGAVEIDATKMPNDIITEIIGHCNEH